MAIATSTDMQLLATDATFGARVQALLVVYCNVTIAGMTAAGSPGAAYVVQRLKDYSSVVLNNLTTYKTQFIWAAACNQTVANDATAGGSLTPATVAASATLCTDIHISNAIAASFPSFVQGL